VERFGSDGGAGGGDLKEDGLADWFWFWLWPNARAAAATRPTEFATSGSEAFMLRETWMR
jgi:hypothetical protein